MGLMGANAQSNKYDLNDDEDVNITDVIALVNYILGQTTPTDNAPCEAVDLGLPSGTKWASCNVGDLFLDFEVHRFSSFRVM